MAAKSLQTNHLMILGVSVAGLCCGLALALGGRAMWDWLASQPFASVMALIAAGLAVGALHRSIGDRKRMGALAASLNVLGTRLSIAEARVAGIDTDAAPALRGSVSELTAEIGLLGGLVRDIAETITGHERILENLHARPAVRAEMPAQARAESAPAASPAVASPPPAKAAAPATAFAEWPIPAPRPAPTGPAPAAPDARADAIAAALREDRIDVHLQPLVSLPQRRVRAYEMLSRLKLVGGEMLLPAEFLPIAERQGLTAGLDHQNVARALAVARHLAGRGSDAAIACNISSASLSAPSFLRGLSRLVAEQPDMAPRILLEIGQRALRSLDAERLGALADITRRGVGLSLDQVTDFRLDPTALADRGVKQVKIRARLLTGLEPAPTNIALADLSPLLSRAGIALVAEHVETEEEVRDLLDLDIGLAQGLLFSPPRPVRSEVFLAPPPPPAEEPPPAALPERKPFRDFLKRA